MTEKTIIDATRLREIVSHQVGPLCGTVFTLYVADEAYYCPPVVDVEAILGGERIAETEYVEERHDCDDFAVLAWAAHIRDAYREGKRRYAYCFGIVFSMGHAFNWFVDDAKVIHFVEPQTSEITSVLDFPPEDATVFMLV